MDQMFDILQVQSGTELLIALIDFAIVYFVTYQILLLIKGTRAVQILIGLIVVIVFYFLSRNDYWTLPATNWFIDKFIANFIIILVIIFQSDIRRALAQFGRTPFFSAGQAIQETAVLEEVIKASTMMSKRRIGALIVLERNADLSHFTEDGIELDAVVSKQVLFSIFLTQHQNPLHDGAVMVQKGRVSAAGCFLPLTNNPKVERTLGTRHRAAIGLTEDTDAAVVVVSEESGIVSIAYQGDLYRELDANEMRDLLTKIFTARDADSDTGSLLEKFSKKRKVEAPPPAEEVHAGGEE